jgi:hypothetical protein
MRGQLGMLTVRMFRHVKSFDSQWYALGFDDNDLSDLQNEICEDPARPPVIQGTGGIRKIRVAQKGRGKSGGARVLYGDFPEHGIVYLFAVYPKSEKEDIDENEKKALKTIMSQINKAWRERK